MPVQDFKGLLRDFRNQIEVPMKAVYTTKVASRRYDQAQVAFAHDYGMDETSVRCRPSATESKDSLAILVFDLPLHDSYIERAYLEKSLPVPGTGENVPVKLEILYANISPRAALALARVSRSVWALNVHWNSNEKRGNLDDFDKLLDVLEAGKENGFDIISSPAPVSILQETLKDIDKRFPL
jgi:hypothetical protein